MREAATLRFLISATDLEVRHRAGTRSDLSLIFTARVAPEQRVRLGRGGWLEQVPGVIKVALERRSEERDLDKIMDGTATASVGCLVYEEIVQPAFVLDLFLPHHTFERLIAAVCLGRLPSQVSIEAEGLRNEPPSQTAYKAWDNLQEPRLNLRSFDLRMPLGMSMNGESVPTERKTTAGLLAPTRYQVDQLLVELQQSRRGVRLQTLSTVLLMLPVILLLFLHLLGDAAQPENRGAAPAAGKIEESARQRR